MKKLTIVITVILFMLFLSPITFKASTITIDGPSIIHKQTDRVLPLSQIITLFSSNDGQIEVMSENYVGNGDQPGVYDIQLSDGVNIKNVQVKVIQTLGNVIAVTDNNVIHVYKNVKLSKQEIIDILVRTGHIVMTSTTQVTTLFDTYSENSLSPGTYRYEFNLSSTDGSESNQFCIIKVSEDDEISPELLIEESSNSIFANILNSHEVKYFVIISVLGIIILIRRHNKKKEVR